MKRSKSVTQTFGLSKKEVAYYQGLGFTMLGSEYKGHAAHAFKKALHFNSDSHYGKLAKIELDKILTPYLFNTDIQTHE